MKKILTTLAGTVALALGAGACSAVDTTETKSIAPVVEATVPASFKYVDRLDYPASRSTTRPVKPVVPVKPPVVVKPKPVVKPKAKVVKPKIVKKPVVKKKTVKKKLKGTKVGLGGIAACIAKYESGGNPRAQNPHSTASGLFQFIDGTWNHFGGYARAMYAPASVQLKKFYIVWNNGKGAGNWVVRHKCGY